MFVLGPSYLPCPFSNTDPIPCFYGNGTRAPRGLCAAPTPHPVRPSGLLGNGLGHPCWSSPKIFTLVQNKQQTAQTAIDSILGHKNIEFTGLDPHSTPPGRRYPARNVDAVQPPPGAPMTRDKFPLFHLSLSHRYKTAAVRSATPAKRRRPRPQPHGGVRRRPRASGGNTHPRPFGDVSQPVSIRSWA